MTKPTQSCIYRTTIPGALEYARHVIRFFENGDVSFYLLELSGAPTTDPVQTVRAIDWNDWVDKWKAGPIDKDAMRHPPGHERFSK